MNSSRKPKSVRVGVSSLNYNAMTTQKGNALKSFIESVTVLSQDAQGKLIGGFASNSDCTNNNGCVNEDNCSDATNKKDCSNKKVCLIDF